MAKCASTSDISLDTSLWNCKYLIYRGLSMCMDLWCCFLPKNRFTALLARTKIAFLCSHTKLRNNESEWSGPFSSDLCIPMQQKYYTEFMNSPTVSFTWMKMWRVQKRGNCSFIVMLSVVSAMVIIIYHISSYLYPCDTLCTFKCTLLKHTFSIQAIKGRVSQEDIYIVGIQRKLSEKICNFQLYTLLNCMLCALWIGEIHLLELNCELVKSRAAMDSKI